MKRDNLVILAIVAALLVIGFTMVLSFSYSNKCDYSDNNYIGKSKKECSTIQFLCTPGYESFNDDCGCGCKKVSNDVNNTDFNVCTLESRDNDVCIELYQPVCGWFDPKQIQCIRYPCAQTFSNSCFACSDEKVLYWTEEECPL